ncbi:hypothetical protein BC834DRAFT_847119 [Gloeopeniophorella convolvens]|nr:hypothetical protein BC834DRAFT_847119 [Gloeopeniophorella convolvens]
MSSETSTKQTFVAWLPDYTDADALPRRLAVRTAHLEGMKQLLESGQIKYGGPTYAPEPLPNGEKKLNGSVVVFEAESAEAVRGIIERDAYWAGNVWDKEKVDIRGIIVNPALAGSK